MWSKVFISTAILSGFILSCSTINKTVPTTKPQKIELSGGQDSTEYELIILDPDFDYWFEANRKPIWYYSKEYLASWNYRYAVSWNAKVRDPMTQNRSGNPFNFEIDYRPNIDYGIDLNYKLYYYFLYVEATWGSILPYDRKK